MTHSANGPTVSLEEARRIEQETAAHLLKSRKLTLIVDLDQTIVHATVDPTVGDWISEGEAWESRQAKRRAELEPKVKAKVKAEAVTNGDGGATGRATHEANGNGNGAGLSSGFEPDPDDEVNPNWEALKDVKKFRLGPEAFLPPTGIRSSGSRKGKERAIENEGCLYYVKPRCVLAVASFWLETNELFGDVFADQDGESSSATYPPNMKCKYILWAQGHMLKRSVRPLTQEGFSLAGGSCRVMRVEVSPQFTPGLRDTVHSFHQLRFDTEEFTTTFSV